jgi:hypothetical protein
MDILNELSKIKHGEVPLPIGEPLRVLLGRAINEIRRLRQLAGPLTEGEGDFNEIKSKMRSGYAGTLDEPPGSGTTR